MTRQRKGQFWEDRASEYLRSRGLRILQRRYRCRFGEIDLVCADAGTLTLVEVRARGAGSLVSAAESINAAKRRRLLRTARHLLLSHPEWNNLPVRFDVVAIDGIGSVEARYEWIKDAFQAE